MVVLVLKMHLCSVVRNCVSSSYRWRDVSSHGKREMRAFEWLLCPSSFTQSSGFSFSVGVRRTKQSNGESETTEEVGHSLYPWFHVPGYDSQLVVTGVCILTRVSTYTFFIVQCLTRHRLFYQPYFIAFHFGRVCFSPEILFFLSPLCFTRENVSRSRCMMSV